MIFTLLCARRASCHSHYEHLIDTGELLRRSRARDAGYLTSAPVRPARKLIWGAEHIHPDMIANMEAALRNHPRVGPPFRRP